MKVDGVPFQNSQNCKGVSFATSDAPLDIASITISGRYPEKGWAMNEVVHEMVFVSRGQGRLLRRDGSVVPIVMGETVAVKPGEWFAWDGDMDIIMACQPAFTSQQYKMEESV